MTQITCKTKLPELDVGLPIVEFPAFFNHSGTSVGSLLSITSAKHYHAKRTTLKKYNFSSWNNDHEYTDARQMPNYLRVFTWNKSKCSLIKKLKLISLPYLYTPPTFSYISTVIPLFHNSLSWMPANVFLKSQDVVRHTHQTV